MASSAAATTVKVVEVRKVTPEPAPSNPFSLPLTFFDAFWIKLPPVERIFLYQVPDLSPSAFRSHLLPKLTRSLSFTLRHFLPLAGNVVWPSGAAVPVVLYNPGEAVSTTVAESTEDFDHVSGDRAAGDSLVYVPELLASDSAVSVLSLQITLFPNRGFCIGVSAHHGILDGKTQSMFIKAWAHTCRQIGDGDKIVDGKDSVNFPPPLPESLTPVFDRSRIVNSEEISVEYLDDWFRFRLKLPGMAPNPNPRSLELLWSLVDNDSKRIRATFDFSKQRIKKLKEALIPKSPNPNYLSSFVLTLAHTLVCLAKAKAGAIQGGFSADFRSRLDPPAPENFFGNCVLPFEVLLTTAEAAEGGVACAAGKIVEAIKEVEKGAVEGAKGRLAKFLFPDAGRFETIGIAGSPRLGMYGVDFGCGGRPRKVEVASTARTGAISMAESRDGSGGFEVGVVMNKEEMDVFRAAFIQ